MLILYTCSTPDSRHELFRHVLLHMHVEIHAAQTRRSFVAAACAACAAAARLLHRRYASQHYLFIAPELFLLVLVQQNTVDTGTVVGHHLGAFSLFFL